MKPSKRPFDLSIELDGAEVVVKVKTGLAAMSLRMTPVEAAKHALTLAAAAENARGFKPDAVKANAKGNVVGIGERR